ncbi:MAG: FGGY-family carbohydrate kinase, partial [Actinomycetota bacterium]|nr:FGGY-family carbohydrate kinase [Actinomycetota bacterium]
IEYALDGGVFAAGSMLEWMCSSLGVAQDPSALGELAREASDSGNARVLPALAGIGAPWWRPRARAVLAGLDGGTTRAMVARAAIEGIAWRVGDIVAAIREAVAIESLRVDGGLTNEPLILQLQADMIGVPVEAAGADATVLGSAVLAAVGSGLVGSLAETSELLPAERRVEPTRDDEWRAAAHDRWRRFVVATAQLDES